MSWPVALFLAVGNRRPGIYGYLPSLTALATPEPETGEPCARLLPTGLAQTLRSNQVCSLERISAASGGGNCRRMPLQPWPGHHPGQ